MTLREAERLTILEALRRCGTQAAAAVSLGISKRVLDYKMRRHGLRRRRDAEPRARVGGRPRRSAAYTSETAAHTEIYHD